MIQLHNTPPPLPSNNAAQGGRGVLAAWLGLALAIAAGGGSYAYEAWLLGQDVTPELRTIALAVVGGLCVAFAVLGAICSGVSFFTGGARGAGLVVAGVLGVLLNAGQIVVQATGGVEAMRAQAASLPAWTRSDAAALNEFAAVSTRAGEEMKQEFQSTGEISEQSEARHTDALRRGLDRLEKSTGGDTEKSAAAMRAFLDELHGEFDGYRQEVQKLINLNPMDPTRLRNKADLQMRKGVVASFRQKNDEVDSLMDSALERLRHHLIAAGLGESAADQFVKGADDRVAERLEIIRQIRDTDRRLASTIGDVLALYEEHWQLWRLDPAGEAVNFDDADADSEIKRLFEAAAQTVREQQYWQERYIRTL